MVAEDNSCYLLMTRVVRLWFTRSGATCTSNCYCPTQCNPTAISQLGALVQPLTDLQLAGLRVMGLSKVVTNIKKKASKNHILTSFKRPKWPMRRNKRLHVKCCLVFGNNKSKQNKCYYVNIKVNKIKEYKESCYPHMQDSKVRYIVTFVFERSLTQVDPKQRGL